MNIDSYVWKDKRLTHDVTEKQVETKLVDMDEDQLQMVYSHCKEMLYNTDSKCPGRMIMIDQIAKQLDYCNAELTLRWLKSLTDKNGNMLYSDENLISELRSWIRSIPDYNEKDNYELRDILSVPAEYSKTKIEDLILACRDCLGIFDHSKITLSFIYKMGLYLTQEELKNIDNDLRSAGFDPDKITLSKKIENHIQIPLNVSNVEIHINPKGLTGSEFRDMINMKKFKGHRACKYSQLTSAQLQTLRSKVLYMLEDRTKFQAKKWQEIMSQIEEVADFKGYKLS